MRPPSPVLAWLLAGVLAVLVAPPALAAGEGDPWKILERVRAASEASGVLQASFVQTYVPAGFTSGEEESGKLLIELPDCMRWDYSEPYPKSFLLCGGVVHAWNPEDRSGRRYLVEPEDEPGLDLLLLSTRELRRRYEATVVTRDDGALVIELEPRAASERLQRAELVVRPEDHRIARIRYRDAEGGTTTFALDRYRKVASRDAFTAPANVDWQED